MNLILIWLTRRFILFQYIKGNMSVQCDVTSESTWSLSFAARADKQPEQKAAGAAGG